MNHVQKVSSRVFSVVVFTSKVATSNVRRTSRRVIRYSAEELKAMRFDVLVWKSAQTRCQLARGRAGRGGGGKSRQPSYCQVPRPRSESADFRCGLAKMCVCVCGGGGGGEGVLLDAKGTGDSIK